MPKRKRNSRGRFVKGGAAPAAPRRRRSTALARRAPRAVAVRGTRAVRRRSSSGGSRGGGALAPITRYLGGVRTDDLIASAGWGYMTGSQRSSVETLVNYAPGFLQRAGGYGVLAIMSGVAAHFGLARGVTSAMARSAAIIAVNKLATRGELYEPVFDGSTLSGDDEDDVGEDYVDVGALDVSE